jgi:putative transposase
MLGSNGEIFFSGADICKILEIRNPSQAYTRLDDEDKWTLISNEGDGLPRSMVFVTESGMYTLILGSRKKTAYAFQKWITRDVLPAIRKDGGYIYGQEDVKGDERAFLEKSVRDLSDRVAKYLKRWHELNAEVSGLKEEKKKQKRELKARNELLDRGYVYNFHYHLIWVTKYRQKMFTTPELVNEMKEILQSIADASDIEIETMEVMPDHIHLLISMKPKVAPTTAVKTFKGISASMFFKSHPDIKKQKCWGGHLWSSSYFMSTFGDMSRDIVEKYIQNQYTKE